jgi:hypothetical protein
MKFKGIFFVKLIILFLIVFVPLELFVIFGQNHYQYKEYAMWKSKIDYLKSSNSHDTNFIIGDSRGIASFIPSILGDNYYNLSLGGSTPIEGYYQLASLIKNNRKIQSIIVSYSPIHFEHDAIVFDRTYKYDFLSNNELAEIFEIAKDFNCKFWDFPNTDFISKKDINNSMIKSYLINNKFFYYYIPEIRNSLFENRYKINSDTYKEIISKKGNCNFGKAEYSDKLNDEAIIKRNFQSSKVVDVYFKKLLDLAYHNSIDVFIITAPFNKSSYDKANKNYLSGFEKYLYSTSNKYQNVKILNSLSYMSNDNFGDPSHLNEKGQIKFSLLVKHLLSDYQNK